jgi:hypothetical protein
LLRGFVARLARRGSLPLGFAARRRKFARERRSSRTSFVELAALLLGACRCRLVRGRGFLG